MVKRLFVLTASVFICYTTAVAGIVEGKVIDADTGEPLIGASVTYAEGKGISTNIDGCFSFDVVNGKCQLTVRYIGYKTVVKDIDVSNSIQK